MRVIKYYFHMIPLDTEKHKKAENILALKA